MSGAELPSVAIKGFYSYELFKLFLKIIKIFQEYFLICQNKYYQLVFPLSKVLVWCWLCHLILLRLLPQKCFKLFFPLCF